MDTAAFIPELADAGAAWTVAARFLGLRAAEFSGGFVLRRFEQLSGAEARSWWVGGRCVQVGPHPDTPDQLPPADLDVARLGPLVARSGLPFVTVDLARRADGVWRVIELGDGQVSALPVTLAPALLLEALAAAAPV